MKKKKTRKKSRKIMWWFLLFSFVCFIGSGVFFVYSMAKEYYNASNYISDEDAMKDFEVMEDIDEVELEDAKGEVITEEQEQELEENHKEIMEATPVETSEDVYNVLLIGVDRRDKSWAGNSDAMILMSLNEKKKQISMISLMRDTYVNIPGVGMRKLNAAHANGAGPLLLKTVEQNFKIDVDRYVSVDFNALITIIDKLGGIELTMSNAEVKVANGYINEMCKLQGLNPDKYTISGGGTRNYKGIQAVAYTRIRYVGNSDYQRTERQRTVLTRILDKMKSMSVTQLFDFAKSVLPLVTHNIPEEEIWDLLGMAPSILQYKLVKDRVPYDGMYSVIYVKKQDMLAPDWEKNIQKLKNTLYN